MYCSHFQAGALCWRLQPFGTTVYHFSAGHSQFFSGSGLFGQDGGWFLFRVSSCPIAVCLPVCNLVGCPRWQLPAIRCHRLHGFTRPFCLGLAVVPLILAPAFSFLVSSYGGEGVYGVLPAWGSQASCHVLCPVRGRFHSPLLGLAVLPNTVSSPFRFAQFSYFIPLSVVAVFF